MLRGVKTFGLESRQGLEVLAALARLLERLGEGALLPAAALVVEALELFLLGPDQLIQLRLAVALCPVALGVVCHQRLLAKLTM